mgnify:CR=1 FL=1
MYPNDKREKKYLKQRKSVLEKMASIDQHNTEHETEIHELGVDIVHYYGILNIVKPKSDMFFDIGAYCSNKNIVMLVIETMCIGIIMPLHIANKFKYIENAINYGEFKQVRDNGMKIVSIGEKWDTRRWSYSKIKNFYNWLSDIETKTCSEIEVQYKRTISQASFMRPHYDMHFLSSLCWNNDLDIENIIENSETIIM